MQARMIEGLAQRYHTTPTAILAEDVGLLRHVAILTAAGDFEGQA